VSARSIAVTNTLVLLNMVRELVLMVREFELVLLMESGRQGIPALLLGALHVAT